MNNRIPWNGTFELTARCNLTCKMCLVRVDEQRICELKKKERTAEEWIDMAKQAFNAGTVELLLTGGEIFMRPDFCEIYEAIAQMGFVLTIYTNATMVTDKIMETLRKYPPHKIGVTMYGASNETYEKMCGCKDGYDRFVEGIKKLTTLPSLFDMRTTVIQDNLHDLPAMKQFTKEMFGDSQTLTISRMVSKEVRGGIAHPKECRLTPEQNVEMIYPGLVDYWRKVKNQKVNLNDDLVEQNKNARHKIPREGKYLFENCGAGINSYSIAYSGEMYACEMLDRGCTNPFETNFEDAWLHLPEQYPLSKANSKCLNCQYSDWCESCPATRLAESGDWFGIPEYSCQEAKFITNILKEFNLK